MVSHCKSSIACLTIELDFSLLPNDVPSGPTPRNFTNGFAWNGTATAPGPYNRADSIDCCRRWKLLTFVDCFACAQIIMERSMTLTSTSARIASVGTCNELCFECCPVFRSILMLASCVSLSHSLQTFKYWTEVAVPPSTVHKDIFFRDGSGAFWVS